MADVYTATWPEARILAYFWTMVRADADRLDLLRQLASVKVQRPPDWDRAAVRATSRRHLQVNQCFGCRTGSRRLYWHHIIEVQYGGSNIADNLVAICLRCHATVHPWLPAERPGESREPSSWSSTAQVLEACADLLTKDTEKVWG